MIKTKVLNAVNGWLLNRDADLTAWLTSMITQGVIEGFIVTAWQVSIWKALIEVKRTAILPNEVWLLYVNSTAIETVTIWNNKKVYLEVNQDNLNDPSLNTDTNGYWITTIKIEDTYPATNYIKLAETDWIWNITDVREFSKTKYFDWTDTYLAWITDWFFEINTN